MKNSITQVSLFVIAFVALSLLMSYTRPAPEEPKQYTVVIYNTMAVYSNKMKFENDVNIKLAEGWHLQGGVAIYSGLFGQAMVK